MPDSESGYQDQHLFPVFQHVNSSQGRNEQLVVQRIFPDDMFPTRSKIKSEILHLINLYYRPYPLPANRQTAGRVFELISDFTSGLTDGGRFQNNPDFCNENK